MLQSIECATPRSMQIADWVLDADRVARELGPVFRRLLPAHYYTCTLWSLEDAVNDPPVFFYITSQPLPEPLGQLLLAKLPGVQQALLRQVNALHASHVVLRRARHALHNGRRLGFQNYAVVDNLLDGQRHQVVVLDDGALVG